MPSHLPGAEPHKVTDRGRLGAYNRSKFLPMEELPDDQALPTGVEHREREASAAHHGGQERRGRSDLRDGPARKIPNHRGRKAKDRASAKPGNKLVWSLS